MAVNQAPYLMNDNGTIVCPLTHREYRFDPTNRDSRKRALAEQQDHTLQEIRRREELAGRPLSYRELVKGIDHPDTRSLREKIADANPAKDEPPPDNLCWARQRIDYLRANPGHDPEERAQRRRRIEELKPLVKQQEAEREAREKATAEAAAIAADPKRQDAIAHSETVFADLRFYKHATKRDVDLAEQRAELARTDPAKYWEAYWPWKQDWEARADAAAKTVTDNAIAEQKRAKEMRQDAREIEERAKQAVKYAKGEPVASAPAQ